MNILFSFLHSALYTVFKTIFYIALLEYKILNCPLWTVHKGHLISNCLFGVFNSPKKTNKNKLPQGTIVVKSKFFIRFLGELKIPKRHFEIN